MPRTFLPRVVFLGSLLLNLANANQKNLAPHVHGEGTLKFVVDYDKGEMELNFVLPALQVLGFEHKPKTDAEKKIHSDSQLKLKDHKSIFTLISSKNAKAACVFNKATLKIPYISDHNHDHGASDEHAHADYELNYRLSCKDAKAVEGFKVLAFQNLKGLAKLKVEAILGDNVISREMTANQIDLLFK